MAFTYSKLAEVTVGAGGASTIDFNNIPQNYTDLVLKVSCRVSAFSGYALSRLRARFNIDSANNYTNRLVYNNSGSINSEASGASSGITYFYATANDSTASTFGSAELYIPNYSGSTTKSVSIDTVSENNGAAVIMAFNAGLWSITSPINSISISDTNGFTFVQHSSATLYGVKAEV
jgi:hypothetical protein